MDVINEVLPTDRDRITEMMAGGPRGRSSWSTS